MCFITRTEGSIYHPTIKEVYKARTFCW